MYKIKNLKKGNQCDLVELLSSQNRDYLIRNNGDQVKIESLHGKTVGIYVIHLSKTLLLNRRQKTIFWNMVETYNQVCEMDNDFEIVWVTIQRWKRKKDKYKRLFDKLFSAMPWLAIPYFDYDARMRFSNNGVLSANCLFIDKQGVVGNAWPEECFTAHGAELYPFTRDRFEYLTREDHKALQERTVRSFLSSPSRDYVISNTKEKVPISELEEKVVGLYFYSTNEPALGRDANDPLLPRCEPSVQLLPKLLEVYYELKYRGEDFEIVMINLNFSKDYKDNEQLFDDDFKLMPWLALPYKDSRCRKLMRIFEHHKYIDYDPQRDIMHNILVIVGPGGSIFDCSGGSVLCRYGIDAYPFTTKAATEKKILTVEKTIPTLKACTLESVFDSLDIKFANAKCGKQVPISYLTGKSIMLFIGHHTHVWTHQIMENLLHRDHDFQVIYVPRDYDMQSFHNFISKMPCSWLTLTIEKAHSLAEIFQVDYGSQGLVAFGPDGRFLTNKATMPYKDCEIYNKHISYVYLFHEVYSKTEFTRHGVAPGFLWEGEEFEKENNRLTYLYPDTSDLDFVKDGKMGNKSNYYIDYGPYDESSSDYESNDDSNEDKSDEFFCTLYFYEESLLY